MVARIDPEVITELSTLLDLLQKEKAEEYKQYQGFLQSTGVHQRVVAGYTWSPLYIHETGYGLGDYPYMVVRRTQQLDAQHQFSGGKQVRLFQVNDETNFIHGTIHYVDKDEMKIFFFVDELPEWIEKTKIGVDVLFDERSYREMEKALNLVIGARNCRLAQLANLLYGKEKATFDKNIPFTDELLNESQLEAVKKIIAAQDIACVHGPPGTGKTTTLVAAIKALTETENSILVCAPSNAAADYITVKLAEKNVRVTRIGNLSRIDDEILSHTIEGLIENHSRYTELAEYKKRALEYRRMAGKYKRSFGPEERRQRDLLYKEARSLSQEARMLEEYMIGDLLQMSDVIVTTLVGVENKYLEKKEFHTVIIDEAAQALEPAVWIAISRAHKVIMAGDPYQLPPTVKSDEARKKGLYKTLLEKCVERIPDTVHLLNVQYRMNEQIMGFSNQQFYHNQLHAHPSVAGWKLPVPEPYDSPLEFIDTAGCGYEEKVNPETLSTYNEGEIGVILEHWKELCAKFGEVRKPTAAIITPYREQVRKTEETLKNQQIKGLSVNTVDAFQGQERDIIYISMVRSNDKGEIGFLNDHRRMNVAMTRARKKLIVVGDSATLGYHPFYESFLNYCEGNSAYRSAWEFIKSE